MIIIIYQIYAEVSPVLPNVFALFEKATPASTWFAYSLILFYVYI